MKTTVRIRLIILLGMLSICLSHFYCTKGKEDAPSLGFHPLCDSCNHGTCVADTCKCDAGYEGRHCDIEWRTKYLASYTCTRYGSDTATFTSTILRSPDNIFHIIITNFCGLGIDVTATITDASWGLIPGTYGNITIKGGSNMLNSNQEFFIGFPYTDANHPDPTPYVVWFLHQ